MSNKANQKFRFEKKLAKHLFMPCIDLQIKIIILGRGVVYIGRTLFR